MAEASSPRSDSQAAIKALGNCRINSRLVWDQLARKGSLHPLIGPEPACGISETVVCMLSGTGCAGNTMNTGCPLQDKNMQRVFSFSPLPKELLSF
jgi:hypothetical protein